MNHKSVASSLCTITTACAVFACSGSNDNPFPSGTGATPSTSVGGASPNGSGGQVNGQGGSGQQQGGSAQQGGGTGIGTGGQVGNGGNAVSGGAANNGGSSATTGGVTTSNGGSTATGGKATTTGGSTTTGGKVGAGGTLTGGVTMTVGGSVTGGKATGGATSTAGGTVGTGGAVATGGSGNAGTCVESACGSHKWPCWRMPTPASEGLPNAQNYTDLGNGAVRDNVTCLVWEKANPATTTSWQVQSDRCAAFASSNYAGFSDWRLPTGLRRVVAARYCEYRRVASGTTGDVGNRCHLNARW